MSNIEIKNCIFKVHPVYDLYAADEAGNVVNIVKKDCIGHKNKNNGYMMCIVRKHAQKGQKTYCVHRFTWECFNGLISDGKVIDHINNIRDDNRLCNLQLVTSSENNKKSSRNRDYTFVKDNHRNKKYVKATNSSTNEVSYYNSLYAVQQHLQINAGIVKMVCEGIKKIIVIINLSMSTKMICLIILKNQLINVQIEYLMKTKRNIKKKL